MQLDLLRHAKSSWSDEGLDDHERPLNARGQRAARRMGRYLASRGELPTLVLCSTALRTRETCTRVLRELPAAEQPELLFEPELYLASAPAILRRIRRVSATVERLLVVGHNPGIAQLAAALAGSGDPEGRHAISQKYPTAALAQLSLQEPWEHIEVGCGELVRFLGPKDLR